MHVPDGFLDVPTSVATGAVGRLATFAMAWPIGAASRRRVAAERAGR